MKFKKIIKMHFKSIGSTNQWCKDNAMSFDRETLYIVTADRQTAGRGRFLRPWVSHIRENLYVSFAFISNPALKAAGHLSQLMALCAYEALKNFGFLAKLKWPNDVLLHNKKVGGILTEINHLQDKMAVIIGIGINVNMSLEVLNTINQPATSLKAESGSEFGVEEVLNALIKSFLPALEIFVKQGFTPFLDAYREKISHKEGDPLLLSDGKQRIKGLFGGICAAGNLTLKLENGTIKTFFSGDVN